MPVHIENPTNGVWKDVLSKCWGDYDYMSSPRGLGVREVIRGTYKVPMPAYIDLASRKVNVNFMFAEAAWIISGSNHLNYLSKYMKRYGDFSDDGVFLRGAYGPKVVDQLGYVVDAIQKDNDTRQAVINIWRERPGPSKDIPCTISMQFIYREGWLHMVTTMRSQDVVLGFTYDVFTFSMVAKAVCLLLRERGLEVELGNLYVTAGSLHLYDDKYDEADEWLDSTERDEKIQTAVWSLSAAQTYDQLINHLIAGADAYGKEPLNG